MNEPNGEDEGTRTAQPRRRRWLRVSLRTALLLFQLGLKLRLGPHVWKLQLLDVCLPLPVVDKQELVAFSPQAELGTERKWVVRWVEPKPMQRFKKRLRLLAEKLGGTLAYDHDGSLRLRFDTGAARFSSLSYDAMHCDIELGDTAFPIRAPKEFVFDIASRLATPHFAPKLRSYTYGSLVTLQNYIDEEHGGPCIESLRKRLVDDPSLVQADLGGNRILVEYYRGVLILCDDLCRDATNVVDFSPPIGR